MAPAAAVSEERRGRRLLASAALFAVAALSLLYILFLFQVYSDPGLRESGFTTQDDIRKISALVFAVLILVTLAIWMRWVPAGPASAPGASAASSGAAKAGGAAATARSGKRVSDDPASRPGAPPSTAVPALPPEVLNGGWKRYKFPAERTGGVYIDSDIVVDDNLRLPADPMTPRGLMILRVRDEVARVCVRCELIDHCHSKVAALITRDDMLGNADCVPGLKRIAAGRIETMRRAKAAAAAPPPEAQEPVPAAEPSPEGALESPPIDESKPAGDSS